MLQLHLPIFIPSVSSNAWEFERDLKCQDMIKYAKQTVQVRTQPLAPQNCRHLLGIMRVLFGKICEQMENKIKKVKYKKIECCIYQLRPFIGADGFLSTSYIYSFQAPFFIYIRQSARQFQNLMKDLLETPSNASTESKRLQKKTQIESKIKISDLTQHERGKYKKLITEESKWTGLLNK